MPALAPTPVFAAAATDVRKNGQLKLLIQFLLDYPFQL